MALTMADMAAYIIRRYPSIRWHQKVLKMGDAQVRAIYFRLCKQDALQEALQKKLKGTQTQMNLEAYKGNGS